MNITKLISTSYDKAKRLILKVQRLGKSDIQTGYQVLPFGFDSNPIGDMIPVFSPTGTKGENVLIGYIQKDQLAEPGQVRIFQIHEGVVGTSIWLRTNNIELGGDANYIVMFEPLDLALTQHNADINAELIKIQAAIAGLGGAYAYTPVTLDLSSAMSTKAKTS